MAIKHEARIKTGFDEIIDGSPVDKRYKEWDSLLDAQKGITGIQRRQGALPIAVKVNGTYGLYWWKDGVRNEDLVPYDPRINQADALLVSGFALDGTQCTLTGTKWRISDVVYTLDIPVAYAIDSVSAGQFRADIIYADYNGNTNYLKGTEGGTAVAPELPYKTVLVTTIFVSDADITVTEEPIPMDGETLFGADDPISTQGKNGDTYIQQTDGTFWKKTDGAWALKYTIVASGVSLPTGGTTGQVLAKIDATDGNAEWVDQSGGGTGNGYPSLAVNSAAYIHGYGTSITAGYLLTLAIYQSYLSLFANKVKDLDTGNNYAVSATNSFSALRAAYANLPATKNRNTASIVEMGFNDFPSTGTTAKNLAKIEGCLKSFLVNAFLEIGFAGSNTAGVTKTGTWTVYDSSTHGGKATYLSGTAMQANAVGATYQFTASNHDNVVIGTYANNGDGSTGSFDVQADGVVVYSYNPLGRTNGITDNTSYDNSITPEPIVLFGVMGKVIKIVTTSASKVIIDYYGHLGRVDDFAPVFVSSIPEMSVAGYATRSPYQTPADHVLANDTIRAVVDIFYGFPVTVVDVNEFYDPETQTFDGIHPNIEGHQAIAKAYIKKILPVSGWSVPKVPVVGEERILSVTNLGVQAFYTTVEPVVSATALTAADFSSGAATVTGLQCQVAYDANYKYECVGVNTWRRVPLNGTVVDLYLADIDDSGGAKTSAQLQTAYPASVVGQRVWGSLYLYEKKTTTLWKKIAIADA